MIDCEDLFHKIHNSNEEELLELALKTNYFGAKELGAILNFLQAKAPALDTKMQVFDCCGTGGDGANTFNISSTAAIIAASNGVRIAKNGGRSTTSKTGSVDVLEALGLDLSISQDKKFLGLEKHNLGFFSSQVSADLLAPLKQIFRKHKLTSFISLLGPLASPVLLDSQVIGVGKKEWFGIMLDLAKTFIVKEKRRNIFLVQSLAFESKQILDELSTASESVIVCVNHSGIQEFHFNPSNFDFELANLTELETGEEDASPKILHSSQQADEVCASTRNHQASALIIENILNATANNAKINTACLNSGLITCLKNKHFQLEDLIKESHKSLELVKTQKSLENFNSLKSIYK